MTRRLATLLLVLAIVPVPGSGLAADEAPREAAQRAYGLSSDLMSPFCPGRTLQDCPSPDAGAVREQIRAWVDAGLSDEEITRRLEASFGDSVVAIPPSPWAWALPAVILVVGLGLLGLALRRAVRQPEPEEPVDPELQSEIENELEAAVLAQLDGNPDGPSRS